MICYFNNSVNCDNTSKICPGTCDDVCEIVSPLLGGPKKGSRLVVINSGKVMGGQRFWV